MSDQDFFFDEDEVPAEETKETKKPAKASGSGEKNAAPKAAAASTGEKTVTMTVASLIGVVALLVGIIVGILIPAGGTDVPPPATNSAGEVAAPQLSPEQLETGELPEGHPDLSGGEAPGMPGGVPPAEEATPTE